jgi:hypothetical protein
MEERKTDIKSAILSLKGRRAAKPIGLPRPDGPLDVLARSLDMRGKSTPAAHRHQPDLVYDDDVDSEDGASQAADPNSDQLDLKLVRANIGRAFPNVSAWVRSLEWKNARHGHEARRIATALDAFERGGVTMKVEGMQILLQNLVSLQMSDEHSGATCLMGAMEWAAPKNVVPRAFLRQSLKDAKKLSEIKPKKAKDTKPYGDKDKNKNKNKNNEGQPGLGAAPWGWQSLMSALAQGVGLFPLPEVESPGPTFSHSRRVQQRTRRAAAETDLANGAVRALNSMFCSLSSTNSLTGNQSSNSNSNSTATLRAVAHVQSCSRRFVSRLAPSFQDSRLSDDALLPQDTRDLFTAAYAFHSGTLPLSAENVALPEEPGSVDLLDILPPALARRYATPTPDLFRPAGDVKPAPACRLVKSDEDYFLIIKRMLGLGMVAFTQDPKVVNGLFGTPKSDGKLRLVFDGRRVNSVFADSPEVELPTPDLLSKLEAEPGKTIFVAKSDLDNFYLSSYSNASLDAPLLCATSRAGGGLRLECPVWA